MYLNLIQVAESFGVSEKVVEDWIRKEGLPHTPDRGRLLFDRAQVANWAAARGLAAQVGFLAPQGPIDASTWKLESLLRAGGIWRDVPSRGVAELLDRIVGAMPGATAPIRELLRQRMRATGGLTIAPVGRGFALPHPSMRVALSRESGLVALLCLSDALATDEPVPDEVPLTRLIFFIAPSPRTHLDLLGRLSRLLLREDLRELLVRGASDERIFEALATVDAASPAASNAERKP